METKNIKVTLLKSVIGSTKKQKDTVAALGLTKIGTCNILADNACVRGMINVVSHMLSVEEA